MTTKYQAWELDVRVRDRYLLQGRFTDKDIEKVIQALPDLAEQAEPIVIDQPALSGDYDDEEEIE